MTQIGSNLEKVKIQNTESIKEVIYKYGPISRLEIAEMLQLTPPTITTNVAELIQSGLVRECENLSVSEVPQQKPALGRRRVLLEIVPDSAYAIGIESGAFGTVGCLTDLRGNVICEMQHPLAGPDYETAMDTVAEVAEKLLQQTNISREKIVGLGIGLPGFVDGHMGTLRYGALYKWKDKAVGADVQRRTGFACRVENNTRCRALREELSSETLRPETFAYFFISRGMACPLIIRSRLHSGGMAGAGEIGHMVVDRFGPICPTCGNRGCLEAVSSETAIRNRCIQSIQAELPTMLRIICRNPDDPQMDEILQAQKCGDPIVSNIMEDAITYAGITLANIINFINPPLVIVDGYIMKEMDNQTLFLNVVRKNLFALNATEVNIEFIPFDKFRSAKGAAALVIKKFVLQEVR